jgi:hypothetical protein
MHAARANSKILPVPVCLTDGRTDSLLLAADRLILGGYTIQLNGD